MTTIAWDGKTLAADSMMNMAGIPRACTKIWKLPLNRLLGCSGDYQDALAVKEYFLDEGAKKEKPKVRDNFTALLIRPIGVTHGAAIFKLEDNLIPIPIKEKIFAIGSGSDFALAAMRLNCDAAVAVSIAIEFDVYSGGLIDAISLD